MSSFTATQSMTEELSARISALAEEEQRVHVLLIEAGRVLTERNQAVSAAIREIGAGTRSEATPSAPESNGQVAGRLSPTAYKLLVETIRGVVDETLPRRCTIAVASRGDPELLHFNDRNGWHFPRDPDGTYAGYYPADGPAACLALDAVRSDGAEYMLFPKTAFWWLDYYPELNEQLERVCRNVWRDDSCAIYELRPLRSDGDDASDHEPNWLAELILGEQG